MSQASPPTQQLLSIWDRNSQIQEYAFLEPRFSLFSLPWETQQTLVGYRSSLIFHPVYLDLEKPRLYQPNTVLDGAVWTVVGSFLNHHSHNSMDDYIAKHATSKFLSSSNAETPSFKIVAIRPKQFGSTFTLRPSSGHSLSLLARAQSLFIDRVLPP